MMNVTDNSGCGNTFLITPRQYHKSVIIRNKVHVGFFDAGEAVNGGTVKHDFAVKGFFDLAAGDGDILHKAVDINELDPEEVDVVLLNELEDVFLGHGLAPLSKVRKITVLTGLSVKKLKFHDCMSNMYAKNCQCDKK